MVFKLIVIPAIIHRVVVGLRYQILHGFLVCYQAFYDGGSVHLLIGLFGYQGFLGYLEINFLQVDVAGGYCCGQPVGVCGGGDGLLDE